MIAGAGGNSVAAGTPGPVTDTPTLCTVIGCCASLLLEEAALNLGAGKTAVLRTIVLPYLRPALIGSAAISFLMSFADFNTTLMLVGADAPLTVEMYGRMREGATPVLNAVSLFLMLASALLALGLMRGGPRAKG